MECVNISDSIGGSFAQLSYLQIVLGSWRGCDTQGALELLQPFGLSHSLCSLNTKQAQGRAITHINCPRVVRIQDA